MEDRIFPRDSMEDYRHLMDPEYDPPTIDDNEIFQQFYERNFNRGGFDPEGLGDMFGDDLPPFAVVPAPNKVK